MGVNAAASEFQEAQVSVFFFLIFESYYKSLFVIKFIRNFRN